MFFHHVLFASYVDSIWLHCHGFCSPGWNEKIGALNFQGNLPPQSYSRSSQYLFSCQVSRGLTLMSCGRNRSVCLSLACPVDSVTLKYPPVLNKMWFNASVVNKTQRVAQSGSSLIWNKFWDRALAIQNPRHGHETVGTSFVCVSMYSRPRPQSERAAKGIRAFSYWNPE